MNSRRDFLKQAAALGVAGFLPPGVRRAMAIDPAPGSTFLDAEHVVILMQETARLTTVLGCCAACAVFPIPAP
jgi:phospholipase C